MKLDLTQAGSAKAREDKKEQVLAALKTLVEKTGAGNDFLGWVDLPEEIDPKEREQIRQAAERIRNEAEALVVIGIGGSYLGARAVIEALTPSYKKNEPEILFAGNQLSAEETVALLNHLRGKRFAINVISKSGTTTEPAVAFRHFKALLEENVGKEQAKSLIFATTDRARGALKTMADAEGYESFVVPDDIGGRFTVLTAVGLLPIAAAGINVDALIEGARSMRKIALESDFEANPVLRYAASRLALMEQGKSIEILVAYEPKMHYVQEWWKQLAGESEGKEGKGLFPASVSNTTDLHSLGQWIQEGPRVLFETVVWFAEAKEDVAVPPTADNLDGLNYLAGKTMHEVNEQAMEATRQAHYDGDVPNHLLVFRKLDAENLGALLYFFEAVIGVTGYAMGVNPFNQPGVEQYKKNMFHRLGKPGF